MKTDMKNSTGMNNMSVGWQTAGMFIEIAKNDLFDAAKKKYEIKTRLIEENPDLSPNQKAEALDRNYEKYSHEVTDLLFTIVAALYLFVEIPGGSTAFVKTIRHFLS